MTPVQKGRLTGMVKQNTEVVSGLNGVQFGHLFRLMKECHLLRNRFAHVYRPPVGVSESHNAPF